MIKIISATYIVLLNIIDRGTTSSQQANMDSVSKVLTSFEFVFILHLMKEIMEITNVLYQALQLESQEILNAIQLVSFTKALIQEFRDNKSDDLLCGVKLFCEACNVNIPDMNA